MGVPCPGCGRDYDVALFAFGRTLHCTCGARVGLEPRVRGAPRGAERFAADAMLGKLARWLRLLGFDTTWEADVEDAALVRRGIEEGRVVLTRDRALPEEWRAPGIYVVAGRSARAQLREVIEAFALAERLRLFTRCSRCNEPLVDASPEAVRDRVPERVLASGQALRACPACDRVYWSGSHTDRVRRVVEQVCGGL